VKQTNTRLDDVKSQSSETMITKTGEQHFFSEQKNNLIPTLKTLISNHLTLMMALIPLVEILILEDLY